MSDILGQLLTMKRPAGSSSELRALVLIKQLLQTPEYNQGDLPITYDYIAGCGLEVMVGENPTCMFTAHVDTVHRVAGTQSVYTDDTGMVFAMDGDKPAVLGADDAAGCYILTELIKANKPGLYMFFMGEERGGIGSGEYTDGWLPSGILQVVSFDRAGYSDVITHQACTRCCSDTYAKALCNALDETLLSSSFMGYFPCDSGVFTDSYNFMDLVPECTNISVGYFNEHTVNETLDVQYLADLAKAAVAIDWEALPIERNPEVAEYLTGFKDNDYDYAEFSERDTILRQLNAALGKYRYTGELPYEIVTLLEETEDLLWSYKMNEEHGK